MWTPLRKEILRISEELSVPKERFQSVPIHQWENIQNTILDTFRYPNQTGFIWEKLKGETYVVHFNYNYPFDQLIKLVGPLEKVWVFIDETVSQRTKFWFYEGYIKDTVRILGESKSVKEVYIASKKYEWLLCVNHHDYIIAVGEPMVEKLIKLEV